MTTERLHERRQYGMLSHIAMHRLSLGPLVTQGFGSVCERRPCDVCRWKGMSRMLTKKWCRSLLLPLEPLHLQLGKFDCLLQCCVSVLPFFGTNFQHTHACAQTHMHTLLLSTTVGLVVTKIVEQEHPT